MKVLFHCIALLALLSSCSNKPSQIENGRYLPVTIDRGIVYILDSQTGRVYFGNFQSLSERVELEVNGGSGIEYIDFVDGAQKYKE